mgnify:CR=1 FL=1
MAKRCAIALLLLAGGEDDRRAGELREFDHARIDPVARAARAIRRERGDLSVFHRAFHFDQRRRPATRAGAADRADAEALHDGGDDGAILARTRQRRARPPWAPAYSWARPPT